MLERQVLTDYVRDLYEATEEGRSLTQLDFTQYPAALLPKGVDYSKSELISVLQASDHIDHLMVAPHNAIHDLEFSLFFKSLPRLRRISLINFPDSITNFPTSDQICKVYAQGIVVDIGQQDVSVSGNIYRFFCCKQRGSVLLNAIQQQTTEFLSEYGQGEYADLILTNSLIVNLKPLDRDIFRLALSEYQTRQSHSYNIKLEL